MGIILLENVVEGGDSGGGGDVGDNVVYGGGVVIGHCSGNGKMGPWEGGGHKTIHEKVTWWEILSGEVEYGLKVGKWLRIGFGKGEN